MGAGHRRHLQQVLCLTSDIGRFIDKIDRNPALRDATVIIHGDHGARISIPDYKDRNLDGYGKSEFERDMRGTFFAVRIPGVLKGQALDMPVRIDDLFRRLVVADFRSLDVDSLQAKADTPYPAVNPRLFTNKIK